jgi:hypothetical protein
MKKLLFISAILLASCGYDGKYRYECQDPANWEAPQCQKPLCEVDGACPDALLGFDPTTGAPTAVDTIPTEETVAP